MLYCRGSDPTDKVLSVRGYPREESLLEKQFDQGHPSHANASHLRQLHGKVR